MNRARPYLIAVLLATLATPAPAGESSGLETLASLMTGSFGSAEQSAHDDGFRDVRLHVARIWSGRAARGEVWLYVEQALASSLDEPYRQRIYRLSATNDDAFESAVWELPGNPLAYAGAWASPTRFDSLSPGDLVERRGCVVELRRVSPTEFAGSTRGRECLSSLRGAAYATSEVTFTEDAMTSWDRGYDAGGNQVWGSTKGPYVFRRME
jgi:CpeT protein